MRNSNNFRLLALLLIVSTQLTNNTCKAQVYNYLPVSHSNIETNPTFVSSGSNQFLTNLSHVNNFQQQGAFSFTSLRVSNYFENLFTGVGLTMSNTQVADSMSYNHVGLIGSYRSLLFGEVEARIGASYKLLQVNSTQGQFVKYGFEHEDSTMHLGSTQNANLAFTLSLKDRHYITYGVLNLVPTWAPKATLNQQFPSYWYLKIGDFSSFFGYSTNREISILILAEHLNKTGVNTSYLLTLFNNYNLSRKTILKYGGEIGYNDLGYFLFRPSLNYYYQVRNSRRYRQNYRRKNFIIVKAYSDLTISNSSSYTHPKPTYSLSLLFHL